MGANTWEAAVPGLVVHKHPIDQPKEVAHHVGIALALRVLLHFDCACTTRRKYEAKSAACADNETHGYIHTTTAFHVGRHITLITY